VTNGRRAGQPGDDQGVNGAVVKTVCTDVNGEFLATNIKPETTPCW
jgi:hypothetical protein